MTSSTRAAALLIGVLVAAFTVAALVTFRVTVEVLERRDDRRAGLPDARAPLPHHMAGRRHPVVDALVWATGLAARGGAVIVRFYRDGDTGPKTAVTFAGLFLAFSVLIGASQ